MSRTYRNDDAQKDWEFSVFLGGGIDSIPVKRKIRKKAKRCLTHRARNLLKKEMRNEHMKEV